MFADIVKNVKTLLYIILIYTITIMLLNFISCLFQNDCVRKSDYTIITI